MLFQESVVMATAKDLTQNFTFKLIAMYFQVKSPNLVGLSFSLPELWAKNLKGGAEHPPCRIGLNHAVGMKL